MRIGLRYHHVLMGAVGVLVCAFGAVRADDPPKEKRVKTFEFESADGVLLEGNLWSNAGSAKKKDATVLLLHNMTPKGGSSRDAGWDDLAEKLLDEGYSVFSFDFRGFGGSTKVKPDKFWDLRKNPQNATVKGANRVPRPESISRSDFEHAYYPQLANDVEAAKAFLDRRNDAGDVNTSSLFVIGAGEGATVGALWMATQWHLRKGELDALGRVLIDPKTGRANLQDPEGKDEAGAIWLSISPTLAERTTYLHSWVGEAGGANRVPMVFLYGGKDDDGKKNAAECLKAIVKGYRVANGAVSLPESELTDMLEDNYKNRGTWKLPDTLKLKVGDDSKLTGSNLLSDAAASDVIVKALNHVMGDRKNLESRVRKNEEAALFWKFGSEATFPIRAKEPTDPTLPLIPVAQFMR